MARSQASRPLGWCVVRSAAAVLLVAAVVSCGGGSSPSATSGSAAATTAATTVPGSEPVTTPGSGPATTGAPSDAEAIAAIRAAYATFFGGSTTTVDAKLAVLEDGETYRTMVTDAQANEQFQALTVDVRDVSLLADGDCTAAGEASPCALVTFDLLVSGAPMLVAKEGHAVLVGGDWKVSASTWCAVVAVGGESCP